ncbi:hypothetical protein [Helicobacter rodentium]|nr:hypothetical protein [Helicobacter rodentium]
MESLKKCIIIDCHDSLRNLAMTRWRIVGMQHYRFASVGKLLRNVRHEKLKWVSCLRICALRRCLIRTNPNSNAHQLLFAK